MNNAPLFPLRRCLSTNTPAMAAAADPIQVDIVNCHHHCHICVFLCHCVFIYLIEHHNTICTSIPFLSRRECYYFLVGALVDLLKKSLCSQPTLQALFVNKIQEYAAKKKAADGGMVDATPETQADLQVLKRIAVSH